jgi:type I restriction enzyme R subunit
MSAEERVNKAIRKVLGERTLTAEQSKWLELIRRHLIQNPTIEENDFELLEFEQIGATWKRVDESFGGALQEILARLNEVVAD